MSQKCIEKKSSGIKFCFSTLLPLIICGVTIICDLVFEDLKRPKIFETPYFSYVMAAVAALFLVSCIVSVFSGRYREKYLPKIKFYTILLLVINFINLIVSKTNILPLVYFPSLDNILYSYIQYHGILFESFTESTKLFIMGLLYGCFFGIVLGTAIGWSKRLNYWIFPVVRFVGPIPTSVWVPFAIFVFPTLGGASEFIIALSAAFPITVLTSSGIQNISKEYFETGTLLGASTWYQIIHIAIPSALPQIFVGIFNGTTLAFMSLMVAELIGVQAGIGWYINWQQKVMSYADVYAGLIILAFMCFFAMKLLFLFRSKFLSWQEGVIRW